MVRFCGLFIIFSVLYTWAFHADKEAWKEKHKSGEDVLKTTDIFN